MSIESKVFSVKQRILHVMQNSALERSDWTLAQYFLLRYNDLGSIRIADAAEQCHVSPSTVRRFCQSLGYDNFTDLQAARLKNPENQYEIALENCAQGRYEPRYLYDEVSKSLWSLGRQLDRKALSRLARALHGADGVIVAAVRPYSFMLQEFQSQFTALSRPLYIFDDLSSHREVFAPSEDRPESRQCLLAVTMSGGLAPVIDAEAARFSGFRALITSPALLEDPRAQDLMSRYDMTFILPLRRTVYEYQEVYGKYLVCAFFDLLMGEIMKLERPADRRRAPR